MRLIKKILLFLLSICLILTIMSFLVIKSGKSLVTRDNLSSYIKEANVLNMNIDTLFNFNEDNITLKEKITNMALESHIPEKIVEDMMASDEINVFLGDFFSKTIDYVINDGTKPKISQDVIDEMNKVAILSLENHINIMMDEEELKECVFNYSVSLTDLIPERQHLVGNFPLELIKMFLNFNLNNLFVIMLFLVILIGLISRKLYKIIKHVGISMIISGVIFVIFGCMDNLINSLIINNFDVLDVFVSPLITNILTLWFKYGILVSFTGVFIYTIYIVINRIVINNIKTAI